MRRPRLLAGDGLVVCGRIQNGPLVLARADLDKRPAKDQAPDAGAYVPHRGTPFRFYSTDDLDGLPDAALRDLERRVTAHRNEIRRTFSTRLAADRLATTDVLVAMIKREQDWRNRTQRTVSTEGGESSRDEPSSEGADD